MYVGLYFGPPIVWWKEWLILTTWCIMREYLVKVYKLENETVSFRPVYSVVSTVPWSSMRSSNPGGRGVSSWEVTIPEEGGSIEVLKYKVNFDLGGGGFWGVQIPSQIPHQWTLLLPPLSFGVNQIFFTRFFTVFHQVPISGRGGRGVSGAF